MKITDFITLRRIFGLTLCLIATLLFYFACMNYTGPTRVGIARNYITGEMWLQEGGGWFITAPWVLVARIDTRPMRVAVISAGHGYSGKLVQFNPRAWQEFVATEGFHYYWWYNRLSINFGYNEEYRGMRDIIRGHAYGAKRYTFIKILNEYQVQ